MLRIGIGIVMACLSVGAEAVTFSDDTFDPADWSLVTTGDGTVTPTQVLAGGNPDAYRAVTDRPAVGLNVAGHHLHAGFVYDPSAEGAIASVDWSVDFQNLNTGHRASLALEQGGTLYEADAFITTGIGPGWVSHSTAGLVAAEFGAPDFSASGAPITFGFRTSNTYDPVAGDIDNDVGYDNLVITVTPVPEPAGGLLLPVGAALLGAARLRAAAA